MDGDQPGSESLPLLGQARSKSSPHYMTANVSKKWADFVLLLGYVITGLLDSAAVQAWGAFVSMQTGNTIYLGLGVADPQSSTRWIKSIVSIVAFCFGAFVLSVLHRRYGPCRRWVLVFSYTAQATMIMIAALITTLEKLEGRDLHWQVLVPLALVAAQSSGQAITSRALGYDSMTSVVLTSTYCDLFGDPHLFSGLTKNAERNRRVAAPILLLIGAIGGGVWSRSWFGLAGALWTAAALKVIIIVAWLLWKEDATEETS